MAELSLRPQPFLGHWAPGAVVTGLASFYFVDSHGVRLFWRLKTSLDTTLLLIAFGLISFAVGQILDSFRDGIVEDLFDQIGGQERRQGRTMAVLRWFGVKPVEWGFFVHGEETEVERLELWFYSHYMVSFNLGVGLLILSSPWLKWFGLHVGSAPPHFGLILVASGVLLLYDAVRIRSFFADFTVKTQK
jgi:hypothetical protein